MLRKLIAGALLGALLSSPALAQSIQLPAGHLLANSTAAQRPATDTAVTALLDRALGSTRGAILERGASGWGILTPGAAGLPFVSAGAGADPLYAILGLSGGGCNAALTASNGGILYSTATACAILPGTSTAGQMLRSGASTTPSWSTSTYPATAAAGTIMSALTANTVTASANPVLGIAGSVVGSISFQNATSGTAKLQPVTGALGTPTILIPAASGTMAVSVSSPLTLDATTGALACATCATLAGAETLTNKNLASSTNVLGGVTMTLGSDATGDIYYRSAGGFLTRLGIGGSSNVLTVSGGLPSWQAAGTGGTVTTITPGGGMVSSTTAACSQTAITITGTLSQAQCINPQTGTTYAIVDGDRGKLITATNAAAQAYTIAQAGAASNFASGWFADIQNNSTNPLGILTITATTSLFKINGFTSSTLAISPGQNTRLVSDGTDYVVFNSGLSVPPLQASPANPTGTASATRVMMGMGATCAFTPKYSTRVQVLWQGMAANTGAGNGILFEARYGTGAAPANGAALTGTSVATAVTMLESFASGTLAFGGMGGNVTGLVPGTAYWFDVSFGSGAGAGTSNLTSVTCSINEI